MKIRPNRNLVLATATILVLACGGLALAQGPHGGGKGACNQGACNQGVCDQARCDGDGPGITRLAARLELSDEQVTAITALQEKGQAQNQVLRKDLLRLRNELEGELLKDAPDAKAAKGLVAKIGELRTTMQQNRLDTRLAVRQQLTPEQRDKMLLMGEGRGSREGRGGQGRHGGHRGGGDCPRSSD